MISVWAKFYPTHRQLQGAGRGRRHLRRMVEPCCRRADGPELRQGNVPRLGRARLRQHLLRSLQSQGAGDLSRGRSARASACKGFDAWWLDSDEPDFHSNLSIEERARRMSPTAAGPGAAFFNSYPLVHVDGVYRPSGRRSSRTSGRSSSPARLRRHPARQRRGLVGRRRLALGRPPRPDLAPASTSRMSGIPNWTPRHRRLRTRSAITKPDAGGPRRMARAQHALVPVRRLLAHCSAATARIISARSSRSSPAGLADLPLDGLVRPAALPADALHLHARRRHLLQRRHDHARAGDGLRRRPARRGTSTTNICSARRSSSRPSPSSRRAAARSICPRARAGTIFYTGRSCRGRSDDHRRRARTSACRSSSGQARSCRRDPRSSTPAGPHGPLTLDRLHRRGRQLLALRG